MSDVSTRTLDHIVHLTHPGTLEESAEIFRKLGFTISPGGTHADGFTSNLLIVLADGVYLELINFTRSPAELPPDSPVHRHPWAYRPPGWIDYASLGNAGEPSVAGVINARAKRDGTAVEYEGEVKGGRERTDGRKLEWLISSPVGAGLRGLLPFFCGDLTPREWRVPLEPQSNTVHANTAEGVAYVKVLAPPDQLDKLARQFETVLSAAPTDKSAGEVSWDLEGHAGRDGWTPRLVLKAASDDEERAYVAARGSGIYEVGVAVHDVGDDAVSRTPYGRIVWVART